MSDPKEQARLDAEYTKSLEAALDQDGEDPRWSALTALSIAAVITAVVLLVTVKLLEMLAQEEGSGPESALSLVFVAAAVVLILVVCTLTIIFKRLRLDDPDEAMGLPKGSVRAVIALMLILLFFIAAVFLYSSSQRDLTGEERKLVDLTPAQYAALDSREIRSASAKGTGAALRYDVFLLPALNNTPTSDDIAKQLVTTVGTLVTAVAAFYFGANSVTTARGGEGVDNKRGPASSRTRRRAAAQRRRRAAARERRRAAAAAQPGHQPPGGGSSTSQA